MIKGKYDLKFIIKYITSVLSSTIFILLLCAVLVLMYYFISLKIYTIKGEKYAPPFSIYTIVSPSMTPKIKVYDVIVNYKVKSPEDIKVGDIITFKSTSPMTNGMTITHRVQEVLNVNGSYEYITKGDYNYIADAAPAQYENVIGKVRFRLPQFGRIQRFISSFYGWLLVVIAPALYVIISDIDKIIRITRVRKDAEKANALVSGRYENT